MKKLSVLFIIILSLTSCVTAPRINTFVLEDGTNQDFYHPAELKGQTFKVSMDFTVQYRGDSVTKVTVNYSLIKPSMQVNSLNGASFTLDDGTSVSFTETKPIYLDRNERIYRFTSQMSPEGFLQLIQQESPQFSIDFKNVEYSFKPTAKFKKQLMSAKTQFVPQY